MPAIRVNPGPASFPSPDGGVTFRPRGEMFKVGDFARDNPSVYSPKHVLAARLFVGFNVGGEATYDIDDLIEVVGRVRQDQGRAPDASFLAQRGVYSHAVDGSVVTEDSAQIIIIDMLQQKLRAFTAEMIDLADQICLEMSQETVIVEIQKDGITQVTHFVSPA